MEEQKKENSAVYEEKALVLQRLTSRQVLVIIVGGILGSGSLSTAYASRLAGWPIMASWMILAAIITTITMLYISETTLRTKVFIQLPGLAELYLGKPARILIFTAVIANAMGCFLAYFNIAGDILNALLGIPKAVGIVLFLIPAVGVAWFGLKAVGNWSKVLTVSLILLIIALTIAALLSERADFSRVVKTDWRYAIPVFNVAAFGFISHYIGPDLTRSMSHDPKALAKTIGTGMGFAGFILILMPFSVLLINKPDEITQVATLAWGRALGTWALILGNTYAMIAALTSYWSIHTAAVTNVVDFFRVKHEWNKKHRFIIVLILVGVPLIISVLGLVGFVNAIYATGVFAGITMAVIPVFMLRKARKVGEVDPAWKCGWYSHGLVQILIILIYSVTLVYAILSLFGQLPAGW